MPNGPAGLHLLGKICRKTNRRQRAIEYYRLSLKVTYMNTLSALIHVFIIISDTHSLLLKA